MIASRQGGMGRGTRYALVAVSDHHLPSPKLEALHVTFSPKYQAMLCVPKAIYDSNLLEHYQVTWSKDWRRPRSGSRS